MIIFAFISTTLGDWFDIASIYVREGFPYVLFYNFIMSCLMFKAFSHFGFISVYGDRKCSNFIDLHVAVQFSQHHHSRCCLFSIVYFCLLCWRLIVHRCVGFFLGSLFFEHKSLDLKTFKWAHLNSAHNRDWRASSGTKTAQIWIEVCASACVCV